MHVDEIIIRADRQRTGPPVSPRVGMRMRMGLLGGDSWQRECHTCPNDHAVNCQAPRCGCRCTLLMYEQPGAALYMWLTQQLQDSRDKIEHGALSWKRR